MNRPPSWSRRSARAATLAVVAVALLAACDSGGSQPSAAPTASQPATPDELLGDVCRTGVFDPVEPPEGTLIFTMTDPEEERQLQALAGSLSGTKYATEAAALQAWLNKELAPPTAPPKKGQNYAPDANFHILSTACSKRR